MMAEIGKWISQADAFLWGPPLLILLLGTHLFYTFRLRLVQKYLGSAFKVLMERDKRMKGNVSPFAALAVALASTIGTGNIVDAFDNEAAWASASNSLRALRIPFLSVAGAKDVDGDAMNYDAYLAAGL